MLGVYMQAINDALSISGLVVFAAAVVVIYVVFRYTLVPALPRIKSLLMTGQDLPNE